MFSERRHLACVFERVLARIDFDVKKYASDKPACKAGKMPTLRIVMNSYDFAILFYRRLSVFIGG